jgi:hypothetical protein
MSQPDTSVNPFENNVQAPPGAFPGKAGRAMVAVNGIEADVADLPDGDTGPEINGEPVDDDEPYGHETSTVVSESVTTVIEDAPEDDEDIPSIEKDWNHETLEYAGHTFGVRLPTSQALTGFSMSTGSYVPELLRQNMVSMFLHRHFSDQSYLFLMMRLMDPDDTDFTEDSFGDIVRMLIEAAGDKITKEIEAKAKAAKSAKPKKR